MSYPEMLAKIEARLLEIKARCDAATPGPWIVDDHRGPAIVSNHWEDETPGICASHSKRWPMLMCDAALVSHARTDLPALAGWALEWIPQWREDLRLEAEEWDPSKVDRADDARLRIDSLARALGIQKERG